MTERRAGPPSGGGKARAGASSAGPSRGKATSDGPSGSKPSGGKASSSKATSGRSAVSNSSGSKFFGDAAPRKESARGAASRAANERNALARNTSAHSANADDESPRGGEDRVAKPRGGGQRKPVHRTSKSGAPRDGTAGREHGGTPKKGTPAEPMRVQRAVARAGFASRREADRLVAEGRVLVNGEVALIGQVIDPATDVITIDGAKVATVTTTQKWFVLNKPAGVMTTRKDPGGRQTVFDLVEKVPGLTYVGRLDFMTEGVLLMTTDGAAAHGLTHPSSEVDRTYVATVQGDAAAAVKAARRGVDLEDGLVMPTDVSATPLGNRRWAFEITITEGRTHEIRRVCDALGLQVERLVRTRFGPIRLGELALGMSRALTPKERSVIETYTRAR